MRPVRPRLPVPGFTLQGIGLVGAEGQPAVDGLDVWPGLELLRVDQGLPEFRHGKPGFSWVLGGFECDQQHWCPRTMNHPDEGWMQDGVGDLFAADILSAETTGAAFRI